MGDRCMPRSCGSLGLVSAIGASVVVFACSAGSGVAGGGNGPGSGFGGAPNTSGINLGIGPGGSSPSISLVVDTSGFNQVTQDFYFAPKFAGTGCTGAPGLYGQAVQEALWWFHVNRSGPGITRTAVQWRGDSHLEDAAIPLNPATVNMSQAFIDKYKSVLDPNNTGTLDMSGGYYDAGDFLKIGITGHFMVHTLGWMMWDFPDVLTTTGMQAEALDTIRWATDYFIKNTYISNPTETDPWKWQVIAYGHQVGAAADHDCGWMPPELRRVSFCPRKAFFATSENPASDEAAGAAAALALTGWHFRLIDPAYAKKCLDHAIALYNFAKQNPGTSWSAEGLYVSSDPYSHLAWAAVWLHEVLPDANQPGATAQTTLYAQHKADYLNDLITPGTGWLDHLHGSGVQLAQMEQYGAVTWTESWTYVWDALRSGIFVKMAHLLQRAGNQYAKLQTAFQSIARNDSLAWVTGPKTTGGFSEKVAVSWGSGRYNAGGQLVALAFAKAFPDDVIPAGIVGLEASAGKKTADVLVPWAKSQAEYLLGKNPINESYMMGLNGYGDHFAAYAHHAATHASIYGLCNNPAQSRHVAYGALVSGPNSGDNHSDDRCDYGANEITVDYNANFFGSLLANYHFQTEAQGQCPDPSFPPSESPTPEFYTESAINSKGACRSQVTIALVNDTAYPPRYARDLTVRYYINVSELQKLGIEPTKAVSAQIIYEAWPDSKTTISQLKPCKLDSSTFYFEMAHPYDFWGRQTKLHGPRTVLLDIGVANGGTCTWDPTNDWGYSALLTGDPVKSPNVPAYQSGKLVWGAEPKCDDPPKVVVPPPVIK